MKTDTNYTTAPFDLEKALAGHPLVTRDGRSVKSFKRRGIGYNIYPFIANFENARPETYTKEGEWDLGGDHRDLFLKIEAPIEPDYTCPRYRAGVLLAFADGAEIEFVPIFNPHGMKWTRTPEPDWDFRNRHYRVAPPKPAKPRQRKYWSEGESIPVIEMTPEVIAALEAAGVPFEKGGEA